MPTSTRERLLSRYHYDPLDRLVNSTPFEQLTQRYYCKTRLATELHGAVQRTIVQHGDQLLALQQTEDEKTSATLLATDQQRSVLNALDANQPNPLAYSPYGHRPLENGLLSLLGFNGERPDPVTGHYHLGNGYRQFNPVLMRFNSPDSWSPFGEGGINAYMYCDADPINRSDPTGHFVVGLLQIIGGVVAVAGVATGVTGKFTKNEIVSEIGVGLIAAGAALIVGPMIKRINSRITGITRNRPPPSYSDLYPNGRQNSLHPSNDAGIEMTSLNRTTSVSSNSSRPSIEMPRSNRTTSVSSDSSPPPTYEQAIEMSRMSHTHQVNSSGATSSPTTRDLKLRNTANGIRGGDSN